MNNIDLRLLFLFLFIYKLFKLQIRELNLTFNKKMFEFTINDLIKNINFAIDKIKAVEIVFNELFIFIITISEYNNITFFNYEHTTLFIYYVVNNQIEFNCIRIIKHINLNINCYKNIVNFIEFHEKKLNKIKLR